MLGHVENRPGRAHLHGVSPLHDGQPVGDVVGGGEVVRDVDDGDAELVAQIPQQIDDRHPQGCVHHRYRLVGDQEGRVGNERPGDGHTLELAAGKLVRIAPGDLPEAQPDLVQCIVHRRLRRRPGAGAKEATRRE